MPDQGRLDLLGLATDGSVAICECKLAANAGARREVLGQVLEYAGQLNGMSLRELRARVEPRIGGDLYAAMAELGGDEWDRETWADELLANLEKGRFQVLIATDSITQTLKRTVLFLNSHTDLAVAAVELQRARQGDVELLVPTVYAEQPALRNASSLTAKPVVEGADTVIVAATKALVEYQRTGAYICQPQRSFREGIRFFGFYARRKIEPFFPRIETARKDILFTSENAAVLEHSSDPFERRVGKIVSQELATEASPREHGAKYQVILLDPSAGFELTKPVQHLGPSAWVQGQRYTRASALESNPATTDDLAVAEAELAK